MNREQFDELEGIRFGIKVRRNTIEETENQIKKNRKEEEEKTGPMKQKLFELFDRDYNDKEKRAKEGFKNQTTWKKELQKQYAPLQTKIDDIATDFETVREKEQKEIRACKNEIMDLVMEHANKHAYYSQTPREK